MPAEGVPDPFGISAVSLTRGGGGLDCDSAPPPGVRMRPVPARGWPTKPLVRATRRVPLHFCGSLRAMEQVNKDSFFCVTPLCVSASESDSIDSTHDQFVIYCKGSGTTTKAFAAEAAPDSTISNGVFTGDARS